jgi:hypothetical protein
MSNTASMPKSRRLLQGALSAALISLASPLAVAQTNALPEPIAAAIRASEVAKADYAFNLDFQSNDGALRARFNPRTTPRLSLLSPESSRLSQSLREDFATLQQRTTGISWCASPLLAHIRDSRLVRQDANTLTYSFQPTAESVTGEQTRRLANRLRGELVVTRGEAPDIAAIRLFVPRPFSPMPLATLERYDVTTVCELAPNGRRYSAEFVLHTRGSGFGRTMEMRVVRRSGDLTVLQ